MGLCLTVSEITGDFDRKSKFFLTFSVFCARPAEGVPFEIGYRRAVGKKKTRIMGLPGRERSLTIPSAVWIHCTNLADGQTPGDSKAPLKRF